MGQAVITKNLGIQISDLEGTHAAISLMLDPRVAPGHTPSGQLSWRALC